MSGRLSRAQQVQARTRVSRSGWKPGCADARRPAFEGVRQLWAEYRAEFGIWRLLFETITVPAALVAVMAAAHVWLEMAAS